MDKAICIFKKFRHYILYRNKKLGEVIFFISFMATLLSVLGMLSGAANKPLFEVIAYLAAFGISFAATLISSGMGNC